MLAWCAVEMWLVCWRASSSADTFAGVWSCCIGAAVEHDTWQQLPCLHSLVHSLLDVHSICCCSALPHSHVIMIQLSLVLLVSKRCTSETHLYFTLCVHLQASPASCLVKNKRGCSPIDAAAAGGRGEVLNALLLACAGEGSSATAVAAMRALLAAGAVPDTWAPNGSSALMLAAAADGVAALKVGGVAWSSRQRCALMACLL